MNTTSRLQTWLGNVFIYCLLTASVVVFALFGIQYIGKKYAEDAFQQQLQRAGLTSLVHYDSVHFDPFTLTPSFENVRVGSVVTPWLHFARISFNHYPLTHPNLDIDFWVKESSIADLSRDTGHLMRAAGVDTLLGKGSLSSHTDANELITQLHVNIKDMGKVTLESHINVLSSSLSLTELRSDLLASFALGQPEAMLSLYGETIELHRLMLKYEEAGLIRHLFPSSSQSPQSADYSQETQKRFRLVSQAMGLAPKESKEANEIANALTRFLRQPETLTLFIEPETPTSIKQLMHFSEQEQLYRRSKMTLTAE
ncbi:hypothetical protein [Marinomonas algarum]|uniref:Uncharacterized protein n=1 Tax=Marinomonas algarum TaxID=2883105 RepID=A0A9X1IPW9_9GAMM|nr:hypothetical protein [Marinomonas algarum]MCB5162276.1 hypothetical protein [Marinomonas algarum]